MKDLKKIIFIIITIFFTLFLYYVATINPSLRRKRDIRNLRKAVKIISEEKNIDMKYSNELIDIIERSEVSSGWSNLPTYVNKINIDFYNESDKVMYSLTFYPNEYDIGFSKREKVILEKDRERFLEIINYKDN